MTAEQRERLEKLVDMQPWGVNFTSSDQWCINAALEEIDRLTAELAKYKHLYESQHHPKHEGFEPTEAP